MNFDDTFHSSNLLKVFEDKLSASSVVGVDGTTADRFAANLDENIKFVEARCLGGSYDFTRYREWLILKGAKSAPRQISIPTVRDALVLRALCDFLMRAFPARVPKPSHTYIKTIKDEISKSDVDDVFLRLDVKSFYPSISHGVMIDYLVSSGLDERAVHLVSSAITCVTGDKSQLPPDLGVPQGLSISNILASIYFSDIDDKISSELRYWRYVDDILVLCRSDQAKDIHNYIACELKTSLALSVHPLSEEGSGKSTIRTLSDGVDYLGFNLSDEKLKVRERSYRRVFDAIVKVFNRKRSDASKETTLWKLNLRITGCRLDERSIGWMFFFRQTEHLGQLHRLDQFVRKQMKQNGMGEDLHKVKSFVKAYREIRYNRDKTTYVPNFDHFTLADIVRTVALLSGKTEAEVGSWDRRKIEEQFYSMVKRQTFLMERETVEFSDRYY